MRSRSNSGVKLDNYVRMVHQTILRHQVRQFFYNAVTFISLRSKTEISATKVLNLCSQVVLAVTLQT